MDSQPSRSVLIAVDASSHSQYALEWAQDNLLLPLSDQVVLVNVRPAALGPAASATQSSLFYEDVAQTLQQAEEESRMQSHKLLQHYGYLLKRKGFHHVRAISIRGDTRTDILRKAQELDVSLILVGSRGLGALQRAFLGSVSNHIVNHAPCPVLVIRPPSTASSSLSHQSLSTDAAAAVAAADTATTVHLRKPSQPAHAVEVHHVDYTDDPYPSFVSLSTAVEVEPAAAVEATDADVTTATAAKLLDATDPHESDEAQAPLLA
ncbi:hypothetical protein RI367_000941 [Sorochytrium milnesiophthora]